MAHGQRHMSNKEWEEDQAATPRVKNSAIIYIGNELLKVECGSG